MVSRYDECAHPDRDLTIMCHLSFERPFTHVNHQFPRFKPNLIYTEATMSNGRNQATQEVNYKEVHGRDCPDGTKQMLQKLLVENSYDILRHKSFRVWLRSTLLLECLLESEHRTLIGSDRSSPLCSARHQQKMDAPFCLRFNRRYTLDV